MRYSITLSRRLPGRRRPRIPPDRPSTNEMSRRVVRVQVHVFGREVAGPEGAAGAAVVEAKAHGDFTIVLEVGRGGRGVEGQGDSVAVEQHVAEPQRQIVLLEWHAGVTGGRDEAAPVGIGAI